MGFFGAVVKVDEHLAVSAVAIDDAVGDGGPHGVEVASPLVVEVVGDDDGGHLARLIAPVVGKGAPVVVIAAAILHHRGGRPAVGDQQVVAHDIGRLPHEADVRLVAYLRVADAEGRVGVGTAVDKDAHKSVLDDGMVYLAVPRPFGYPDMSPLAGEGVVPAVVAHRGEEHGPVGSALHFEGGAIVDPQDGVVVEIEFVALGEGEGVARVDHRVAEDDVRQVVPPARAVDDAVGIGTAVHIHDGGAVGVVYGVGGHMVDGVAAVGREGQPLDVGGGESEEDGVLY